MLVGVGGGVELISPVMWRRYTCRGISFDFVPTSILADRRRKRGERENGVDVGVYKNMVGTIRQPDFTFLEITPFENITGESEWVNGFAEVIKTRL